MSDLKSDTTRSGAARGAPSAAPPRRLAGVPRRAASVGFGGREAPEQWPVTGSTPRPDVLERPVDTLAGVGPAVRRKLGRLGIETVGDVLAHRPRRYESAAEERTIAALFGEEEAVLDVRVRRASSRRRGRLHILTAHVADDTGEIRATWFNQPWLEARLAPGTRLRLRGKQNRFGFQVSTYDVGEAVETADFAPVYPSTADLAQKTLRTVTEAALAYARAGGEPLPAGVRLVEQLPLRADALVGIHRPRGDDDAEQARRRLALDELLTLQLALRRRSVEREALVAEALPPGERAHDALPGRAAVHADGRAGARDRRDRRRPRPHDAHAAPAPGRRRLGQDGGRPLHAAPGGRGRTAGRAHGTDGDARRAALPHDRAALCRAGSPRGPPHLERHGARAAHRAPARRLGRRRDRGRHACPDPARGGVRGSRRRGRRRAAPLRRRAARGARRGPLAPRPAHDRDADPTDARPHRLRRPVGLGDLHASGEPQADRDGVGHRGAQRGGVRAPTPTPRRRTTGLRRLPARRGLRDDDRARGRGRGRAATGGRAA